MLTAYFEHGESEFEFEIDYHIENVGFHHEFGYEPGYAIEEIELSLLDDSEEYTEKEIIKIAERDKKFMNRVEELIMKETGMI